MYDVLTLLNNENISYITSGKNVTAGWAELRCIYPTCHDPSKHLGINLQTGWFHCWSCSNKGDFIKFIMMVRHVGVGKAKEIAETLTYGRTIGGPLAKRKGYISPDSLLPKECCPKLPKTHSEYLIDRGLDPKRLVKDYKILACDHRGEFPFRIIIPIFVNGTIVSFTSRDVTGQQRDRYKSLSVDKSIIPAKDCLYNIDNIANRALIVEGPFDVFKLGGETIATLGTGFTKAQVRSLIEKELDQVYILYDVGADKQAKDLAYTIAPYIKEVEILTLDHGDPGEMTEKEVKKLKRMINMY